MKTILITGCSSGIGKDTCLYFQKKGWNVAATMRDPNAGEELAKLENVKVFALDVTDKESISQAVESAIRQFGKIDVLVNNAGYGLAGPLEAASSEQIERQYKTNVYGPIYVMQELLPHFRERKSGCIVNITSVGGLTTLPFNSLYHGTKYALEGISESLNFELNPFGIQVKLVEPGGVKTEFAGRSLDLIQNPKTASYDEMMKKVLTKFMDPSRQHLYSTGTDIAKVIFTAATDGKNKMRYVAGNDAKKMLRARKFISDFKYIKLASKFFGL